MTHKLIAPGLGPEGAHIAAEPIAEDSQRALQRSRCEHTLNAALLPDASNQFTHEFSPNPMPL
jgi:hypothetical protein